MFKEFDAEKQFRVNMDDLKATFDVMSFLHILMCNGLLD